MENAVETTITIYEGQQERTFLFTCPKCGSHKLLEENTDAVIRLSVRSVDIESKSTGEVQMVEPDYTRDCELLDLMDDGETLYVCNDCGFELENTSKDGTTLPINDQDELAEWILNNCKPQY